MTEKSSTNLSVGDVDYACFAPWLEEILPTCKARSYIFKSGQGNYCDDIIQTVSMRMDNARQRGTADIRQAYVFTAVVNLVRDRIRRSQAYQRKIEREKEKQLAEPQRCRRETLLDNILKDEDFRRQNQSPTQLIEKHIDSFDLRTRVALKLKHLQDCKLTFGQIAEIIGYSESTARQEYKKARGHLERCLRKYIQDNES